MPKPEPRNKTEEILGTQADSISILADQVIKLRHEVDDLFDYRDEHNRMRFEVDQLNAAKNEQQDFIDWLLEFADGILAGWAGQRKLLRMRFGRRKRTIEPVSEAEAKIHWLRLQIALHGEDENAYEPFPLGMAEIAALNRAQYDHHQTDDSARLLDE